MIFDQLTYEELLEDFLQEYFTEYGRQKFEKVHRKIKTSKKISSLIYLSEQKMGVPTKEDYLYSLNEVPFFLVSKAETMALGGLLALERWNQECNQRLYLANDDDLKDIAIRILNHCKKLKVNL